MRDYDFESSIGYWVCTTSHIYQRRIDRELTSLGITFRQFQVLAWLALEGELSQADLAERMMIEPPTLVRILDRMQSQGLVRRTASETDRRRKHIQIDKRAEPIWDQVVDCLKRVRSEATAQMSDEEVATLQSLLQRMQQNLTSDLPRAVSTHEAHTGKPKVHTGNPRRTDPDLVMSPLAATKPGNDSVSPTEDARGNKD